MPELKNMLFDSRYYDSLADFLFLDFVDGFLFEYWLKTNFSPSTFTEIIEFSLNSFNRNFVEIAFSISF